MGLFDDIGAAVNKAAADVQTYTQQVVTTAVNSLPSGDQYQSFVQPFEEAQQAVATQLATLPLPGATLFLAAPQLTQAANDVVSGGYDSLRMTAGSTGTNPYLDKFIASTRAAGSNNTATSSPAPVPHIVTSFPGPAPTVPAVVVPIAAPAEYWPYFRR